MRHPRSVGHRNPKLSTGLRTGLQPSLDYQIAHQCHANEAEQMFGEYVSNAQMASRSFAAMLAAYKQRHPTASDEAAKDAVHQWLRQQCGDPQCLCKHENYARPRSPKEQ